MKRALLFFFTALLSTTLFSQVLAPVKWSFSVKEAGNCEAELTLTATIEKGWHLYSQKPVEDGPVPTTFTFIKSASYELAGKTKEPKGITKHEPVFGADLTFFEHEAVFTQKIKIKSEKDFVVKGSLEFMVCDDGRCLPPETVNFEFKVKGSKDCAVLTNDTPGTDTPKVVPKNGNSPLPGACDCDSIYHSLAKLNAVINGEDEKMIVTPRDSVFKGWTKIEDPLLKTEESGFCDWWGNFWEGALWGLLAVLTPCVYSMIPLTVSFFTKQSKTRKAGIRNAMLYGIFIIAIFVVFALLITVIFGPDALNEMASNVYANLFFFLIFIIFAASFLGAFEIVLPSSWVNKADATSDKGGVIGIFGMAFTLVLVSFSCTGPFVGNLLVLVDKGSYFCPAIGMFGFSFFLALPFVLFALFPSWLNSMPKSGGWLNAVKVCLGLAEIALAMKFLSNADLVGEWHLVSRELFIAVWICVGLVMSVYLFGFIKFSHDSPVPFLTVSRTFIAVMVLSFTIYLIPGLWGAPLKLISGFPPPGTPDWSENTSFFRAKNGAVSFGKSDSKSHKTSCPHDLNCFHDYFEALDYAKSVNKPLLLDFTGWTCVNCRKMEDQVWINPEVLEQIREDYVLVSLYVDDRKELPENYRYTSATTGKEVRTVGNLWHDMQVVRYNQSAQPYYVLLDHNEKLLMKPKGYTPSVKEYSDYLKGGTTEFKSRK